jgi:hypothetical protein
MEVIWIPIIVSLGFFATIAYVAMVINRRRQAQASSLADIQTRLLDKFGSSREFVDFLQTDGGKTFLTPLSTSAVSTPKERILRSVRTGIVVSMIGAAFLVLAIVTRDADDAAGMAIPGVLTLSVGFGFLLSAVVSYKLSKAWGMMPEEGNAPPSLSA